MSTERERREHILAVAERLLRHYGPQKTTIAEIARAADVGVGTVYLEFPSKEAIVEELSQGRHGAVLEAMRAGAEGTGSYSDRIRAVFDARLAAFRKLEEEGAHARDLVHCMNSAVKSAHARFKNEELALVAALIRSGASAGELVCVGGSPESTARSILRAYSSFAPPYVFGVERHDLDRELEAMHALVLEGLLNRDAPLASMPAKRARKNTKEKK
jgi:AcrR family transcriptional regulator